MIFDNFFLCNQVVRFKIEILFFSLLIIIIDNNNNFYES